eukprot:scaffold8151_cov84-Cylindrotheca_fusiformis.AAC.1
MLHLHPADCIEVNLVVIEGELEIIWQDALLLLAAFAVEPKAPIGAPLRLYAWAQTVATTLCSLWSTTESLTSGHTRS